MSTHKPQVKGVEIAPSWTFGAKLALIALECGTPQGKEEAKKYVLSMAQALDATQPVKAEEA